MVLSQTASFLLLSILFGDCQSLATNTFLLILCESSFNAKYIQLNFRKCSQKCVVGFHTKLIIIKNVKLMKMGGLTHARLANQRTSSFVCRLHLYRLNHTLWAFAFNSEKIGENDTKRKAKKKVELF